MRFIKYVLQITTLTVFLSSATNAGELGYEKEYGNEAWFGSELAKDSAYKLLQLPKVQDYLKGNSTPKLFGKCTVVFTLLMEAYENNPNIDEDLKLQNEYFSQSVLFLKHHYLKSGYSVEELSSIVSSETSSVANDIPHAIDECNEVFVAAAKTVADKQKTNTPLTKDTKNSETQEPQTESTTLHVLTKPQKAKVRILNIGPKYKDGIELKSGDYHIEVSANGYATYKNWHRLESGEQTINVQLVKSANKAKKRSEYKFYGGKSKSCTDCISLAEVQNMCSSVNTIASQVIQTHGLIYDYQLKQLVENTGMSGIRFLDAVVDPVAGCVVVFNASGIINGSSFNRTYACDIWVLEDNKNGGYLVSSIDSQSCASR